MHVPPDLIDMFTRVRYKQTHKQMFFVSPIFSQLLLLRYKPIACFQLNLDDPRDWYKRGCNTGRSHSRFTTVTVLQSTQRKNFPFQFNNYLRLFYICISERDWSPVSQIETFAYIKMALRQNYFVSMVTTFSVKYRTKLYILFN